MASGNGIRVVAPQDMPDENLATLAKDQEGNYLQVPWDVRVSNGLKSLVGYELVILVSVCIFLSHQQLHLEDVL